MNWFVVAFIAQIFWSIGNLVDKYLLSNYFDEDEDGAGVLFLYSTIFAVFTLPIIYFFSVSIWTEVNLIGLLILNGFLTATWLLLYLYAIEEEDVGIVVPIFQTIPIFGLVLGMIFLNEILSVTQIIAGGFIVSGALLLTIERQRDSFSFYKKVFFLMISASFIIAVSEVLFKYVALQSDFWVALFWTEIGFVLSGLLAYLLIAPYRNEFHRSIQTYGAKAFGLNGVNEIIDTLGSFTFFFALLLAPVALVQTANAYQPLIVFIAGYLFAGVIAGSDYKRPAKGLLIQRFLAIIIIVAASYILYTS